MSIYNYEIAQKNKLLKVFKIKIKRRSNFVSHCVTLKYDDLKGKVQVETNTVNIISAKILEEEEKEKENNKLKISFSSKKIIMKNFRSHRKSIFLHCTLLLEGC